MQNLIIFNNSIKMDVIPFTVSLELNVSEVINYNSVFFWQAKYSQNKMLLNELFALSLIPSLIVPNNGTFQEENFTDFSIIFDYTKNAKDRLLAQVNQEVAKLNLEYPDDYFDHLEDNSGEVRNIIRKRRADATSTTTTTAPTTTATTKRPLISSALDGVKTEAGSLFGKITNPISSVGKSLFGKKTTTTTTTTTTLAPEEVKCSTDTQIFFQGACRSLLSNDNCPPNQWLIEDPKTLLPTCVLNSCAHIGNTAKFGDNCTIVGSTTGCHSGMVTYIYRSGVVQCDCKEGHLFNEKDSACYPSHRQGPCPSGQYFILSKEGKPECVSNPCIHDGYFCNAPRCSRQRNCERLDSDCEGEENAKYEIDPISLSPFCNNAPATFSTNRIIGNVPTLTCAPGSRRDLLGNCRAPTVIDFS